MLATAKKLHFSKIISPCCPASPPAKIYGCRLAHYHSVKAYSRGVRLFDMAIVVAARQTQALLWNKDKKLLSIMKKEEIFHAKK